MRVTVSEAKGQLTELVRRAEAGEEVVITRYGNEAVRLVPVNVRKDRTHRRRVLQEVMADGAANATPGPSSDRSQDFLYDEFGVPK